jgi:hypothetical protein
MVSLLDFVAEFLASTVRLVVIFVIEVALRDPLGFVAFAVGAGLTTATLGFFAYLVLGAALEAVGIDVGSPGRTPRRERVETTPEGGPRTGN